MFLNKDALKLNGHSIGQYLLQVEYGYNKVWGSDTGRNMLAETSGTLLGIIVKLKLTFRELSQEELEFLAPILDSAFQTTTYYDPYLKRLNPITTYTGDWATLNKNTFTNVARANESFDISVIATKPREVL